MPNQQTREMQTRELCLRVATANENERSVDAVLATERPVEMFDWRHGEIIEEILRVDGVQMPPQVPLLDTHSRFSAESIFGSVRGIRSEGEEIIGRLYFADDEASQRTWRKVRDGHLTDVSVGYLVQQYQDIRPGETEMINGCEYTAGGRRMRVVTRWQLREVSVVPIGADQFAKMRGDLETETASENGGNDMPEARTEAAGVREEPQVEQHEQVREAPAQIDESAIREAAVEAERHRVRRIRESSDGVPAEIVQRAIDDGWDEHRCNAEFLQAIRGERIRQTQQAPAGHSHSHESDCNVRSLAAAWLVSSGRDPIGVRMWDGNQIRRSETLAERDADLGDQFRGMSSLDLVRECARMDTGRYIINPREAFRAAVSGTSLDRVFTTNVYASLMAGWKEVPDTSAWCQEEDVPNFMTQEDITLRAQAALDKHPRGKVASHATAEDDYETYKIARYAKQFAADEQDVIDDRLGAIMQMPREMGAAARRLRPDLVYALILANPTLTATSGSLFNATAETTAGGHANQTTAVLGTAGLGAAITAMKNKRLGTGRNAKVLNIRPSFLIVPPDLEWTALALLNSGELLQKGNTDAVYGTLNYFRNQGIAPVVEARIDASGVTDPSTGTAYSGSATNWFLAARERTIKVAYLRGTNRQPSMRSYVLTQGQWGIGWDINMDIGVAAVDYRGLHKSTGAG